MTESVFIFWTQNSPRAQDIAAAFRPPLALWAIQGRRLRKFPFLLPVRYLEQARLTWKRLRDEKPRALLVQSPPVFAALVVAAYARRTGARWVIDLHTGPFTSRRWSWSLPIHRWLAPRAAATLVHGSPMLARTADWQGLVLNSEEPPPTVPFDPHPARDARFRVQVISSFSPDEPLESVLAAASRLPDVAFHITGDLHLAPSHLTARAPQNVTFTGFLSRPDYFRDMASARAVMVLSTYPGAIRMGAWEAMYLGQPLILSDHPLLREYFQCGAIFVANTPAAIANGIRLMKLEESARRGEIESLAAQKRQSWEKHFAELKALLLPS